MMAPLCVWGGLTGLPLLSYAVACQAAPPAMFALVWALMAALVVAVLDVGMEDDE